MTVLSNLEDIFKNLPILNFDSKKQYLVQELSTRFPNNEKLIELVHAFQKSKTIVHPYDFPLSDDFIDKVYATTDEKRIESLLQARIEEQNNQLENDYTYRANLILNQYERFSHEWNRYEQDLTYFSAQIGKTIDTKEVSRLMIALQEELKSIK